MSSDSDRTIDSDELEEIIAQAQREQCSSKLKGKATTKNLKRISCLHGLSESDSDNESKTKIRKNEVKKPTEGKPDNRPHCKYGSKCYRKNPDHKREFFHPNCDLKSSPGTKSTPTSTDSRHFQSYQFFVTPVNGISSIYNSGISYDIKDLLSFEDGTLTASVQFNYVFDVSWLIEQYPAKYRKCPIIIVHGEQRESKKSLEKSGSNYPNIKFCQAKLDIPFGTHHTKMMFLLYKEGFRIVLHTSNIVPGDWAQKTQGMWISPLLPVLKNSSSDGESPTKFKADMLEYISSYGVPELEEWKQVIKRHNFSKIKVVLIGSVPGRHIGSRKTSFGHLKLRKILNLHGPSNQTVQKNWSVICQFSSIGSLGANADQWLCTEFASSLVTCKDTSFVASNCSLKLVYPSVENVRKSLEGYPAGVSLPYSIKVAQKQPYLKSFLHQWKSDKLGRTEASPHIKTYLRLSPDNKDIAWFLVSSANLSKAAWGSLEKKGSQLMIRSYELGILFLPKYFGVELFPSPLRDGVPETPFPVPYDIPVQPYSPQDEPWIWDIPHVKGPDRFGNMWCPP